VSSVFVVVVNKVTSEAVIVLELKLFMKNNTIDFNDFSIYLQI